MTSYYPCFHLASFVLVIFHQLSCQCVALHFPYLYGPLFLPPFSALGSWPFSCVENKAFSLHSSQICSLVWMTRGNDAGRLDTKYIAMVSAHTIGGLYKLNNTYLFNNQQPVQGVAIDHDHALVVAQLRLEDLAPLN